MKRTLAFIPLTVIALIATVVACNKVAPPAPSPMGNSTNSINGSNAKQIPKAWDVAFGRTKGCHFGPGGCLINESTAIIVPGGQNAAADGDITASGHLLISVHLDMLHPAIVNELIATQQFEFDHEVIIPQHTLDALCDHQTPSIPHWGGPVGIQVGNYPLPVTNGAADQILEMEGTYDSAANSWSWEFWIH
jgi:hypothetical protein